VFPLRLILLTPIFSLIGGGDVTTITMAYAMVADVTEEAQRYVSMFLAVIVY